MKLMLEKIIMPGTAGSKYGIINDGLPVTAKEKVMSKLEPPNAAESAFEFMRATGVFPTRNGDKWSISYLHAGGFLWHTLRQIDWRSLAFDTPLEAVQAAMKALEDLKPAWPEHDNREKL